MIETIALVFSFTNDFQDIPYRVDRIRETSKSGKVLMKWTCTCPAFINRGRKTCKHITCLQDKNIVNNDKVKITDLGKKVLGYDYWSKVKVH